MTCYNNFSSKCSSLRSLSGISLWRWWLKRSYPTSFSRNIWSSKCRTTVALICVVVETPCRSEKLDFFDKWPKRFHWREYSLDIIIDLIITVGLNQRTWKVRTLLLREALDGGITRASYECYHKYEVHVFIIISYHRVNSKEIEFYGM